MRRGWGRTRRYWVILGAGGGPALCCALRVALLIEGGAVEEEEEEADDQPADQDIDQDGEDGGEFEDGAIAGARGVDDALEGRKEGGGEAVDEAGETTRFVG